MFYSLYRAKVVSWRPAPRNRSWQALLEGRQRVKTTQMREKSPADHLFPTGNWKSIFTLRGKMERISVLMDRVGGGMNLAVKKSTTERLFGVKNFRGRLLAR